ncbi:SPARC Osteonectin [Larimichthys crocea]|uniref:SPARC Osteonectin n=1 Tax=Larimichthys crocea TaxID=215358 RepID=A0A6G0J8U6_LARCR|nr:SPARC Osteonectin [Larimichthys crocea]
MRACLVFLCLLAATFALSVKSKPHGKHGGLHKTSHTAKEKDIVTEEANKPQILPTLVPLEEDFEVTEGSDKSTAVLLSEEELVDLLKKEAEEEQEAEEIVLEEEEVKTEKSEEESGEIIEDEVEEKTLDDKLERGDAKEEEEERRRVWKMLNCWRKKKWSLKKPHTDDTQPDVKEKETSEKGLQTIADDYEQNVQNTEAVDSEEASDQDQTRAAGKDEEKRSFSRNESSADKSHSGSLPSSRSSPSGHPDAPADPCDNFPCKRGKTCKLDADNKPGCVCQEPSECPPGLNEFDHVCGTDNKTYDTACELFATKCNLEGTKRGHRLHLDYTGSCKLIPACEDSELVQFPLRMRDWLKNVLLQLYEHDSVSSGFLTPKQRFRVKKIFESERRLHAGDHSVELLVQDFEKNYNMYIYPVHWQFAQLDQHPADRFLTHSELAPLRVPLVPMEHCTSRFFQECDADKDKLVSFKEWTSCFGIKNEDTDVNLLF